MVNYSLFSALHYRRRLWNTVLLSSKCHGRSGLNDIIPHGLKPSYVYLCLSWFGPRCCKNLSKLLIGSLSSVSFCEEDEFECLEEAPVQRLQPVSTMSKQAYGNKAMWLAWLSRMRRHFPGALFFWKWCSHFRNTSTLRHTHSLS
jgi:hypothetical protein